jgi:hypothetical protein
MQFFIPGADDSEREYADLFVAAKLAVPPAGERVPKLVFTKRGGQEEWTAKVGRRLRGV